MNPEKIANLRDEIQPKLADSLMNLNEVLDKYQVLKGAQIQVTLVLAETQQVSLVVEDQQALVKALDAVSAQATLSYSLGFCGPPLCPPPGRWL